MYKVFAYGTEINAAISLFPFQLRMDARLRNTFLLENLIATIVRSLGARNRWLSNLFSSLKSKNADPVSVF